MSVKLIKKYRYTQSVTIKSPSLNVIFTNTACRPYVVPRAFNIVIAVYYFRSTMLSTLYRRKITRELLHRLPA